MKIEDIDIGYSLSWNYCKRDGDEGDHYARAIRNSGGKEIKVATRAIYYGTSLRDEDQKIIGLSFT